MVHFAVSMVTMGTTSKALGFIPLHFSETCSLENQTFFSCVVVCVCVSVSRKEVCQKRLLQRLVANC